MGQKSCVTPVVLCAMAIWTVTYGEAYGSSAATCDVPFKGAACGGSLILTKNLNRNQRYVAIRTSPGETAESVAQRMAEGINASHVAAAVEEPPHRFHKNRLWVGGFQARASGGTLTIGGGCWNYALAGSERGLGIPKPPLYLSCSYDKTTDKLLLRWMNPPDDYDFILVKCYSKDFENKLTERISGASTGFLIDRKKLSVDVNDFDARVIGFRNAVPSNAASIHLNGYCQEEIYGIPFTGGVAPNWTPWSNSTKAESTAFEQGEKYNESRMYNPSLALLTKPFYQVIKAPAQGSTHGVWRKFLGLTPGHTYRITACLNTLEMDSIGGDWSLSLCAAHNGRDGKDLTVEQLAGAASLPDSSTGAEAGLIAFYGPGNTTKGNWAIVLSGDNATGAPRSSHIPLPSGVDAITVWVRFSCSNPNGKVGFSGVKLEDISASDNVKPRQEVIEKERREERLLLQREAVLFRGR